MLKKSFPWITLLSTGLGGLIIAVDFTVVNTILANIQQSLHTSMGALQWVMVSFGLLFCSLLIAMGRIGDMIGCRRLLILGLVGFGLASLSAGLSTTLWQLIASRVLQGIFGAIVFPCGMALVAKVFPKEKQGRALGIYGSILGAGIALGPILGGIIVHLANWRWVFFVNIPFLLLSLALILIFVKGYPPERTETLNMGSVLLLTLSLSTLMYAINELPIFGITSPIILGACLVFLVSGFFLFRLEKRVKHPLLPMPLLKNTGFALSCIVSLVSVSIAWAILFIVPLYLHKVIGLTTFQTGLLMIPMTFMTLVAPVFAGYCYDNCGPKPAVIIMFCLLLLSYVLQLCLGATLNLAVMIPAFVAFGLAWGMGNGLQTSLALSKLSDMNHAGVVSGSGVTVLNMLGIISLAVGAAIFRAGERTHLNRLLTPHHVILNRQQTISIHVLMSNHEQQHSFVQQLGYNPTLLHHAFKEAFVVGYHTMIWTFLVLTAICGLLAIGLLKRHAA